MAAAGEGTSSSYGGGGRGAGGKFPKRSFRRPQTTPYDRPPTAFRNSRDGWLSKLADPASKLVSASAQMFLSSVFRKRLLPPPQPSPGPNQESREDTLQNPLGAQESALNNGSNLSNCSNSSGISELEEILRQKTFTRSEVDRLTELLHSRSVDLPVGNEIRKTEANLPEPPSAFERKDDFTSCPMPKSGTENCRLHGGVSTPIVSSRVLEEDVASPVELAKAYMGSRYSKATTSMLALRGQAPREDTTLLNNIQFSPKSSSMSLAPKAALRLGVTENGFITPRFRGRSAIYNMARTPYSRVYSAANQKGVRLISDGYGEPSSSSQYAWERDGRIGSKQVAHKRRSSVLDDDIGSVGPIRRIRQKPNLLSPKNLSIPVSGSPVGVSSDTAERPSCSTKKLLLLDEPNHKVSTMLGEYGDNSVRSTSFSHVPSKSTELATKILQHLEKLSPKEKSSEAKLAAERDKSPTMLTPSMPSGKAFRTPEDVDASKFLQNAKDGRKLQDSHNTSLPDARDSSSQKQDKVEENNPKALFIPSDTLAPAVNNVDATVSVKDTVPSFKYTGPASANFVALPPQKKRAFQMSAHEDSLELDYDVHSNGVASTPLAEGREKLKTSVVESKAVGTETEVVDKKSASCEVKPPAGFEFNKRTGLETNNGSVAGEKSSVFTFPPTPAPSPTLQPTLLTQQLTSGIDKIVPANVPPSLFSFGLKNVEEVPLFKIPSSSPASESSDLKSSALLDPKPEGTSGFVNVASGATDAVSETSEAEKYDDNNSRNAGVTGNSGKVFSSALSNSSSTSSIFSFGAPANNSFLNNGLLSSSPSLFSSAAPVQSFTNNSMHVTSATTTIAMNSTSITTTTASSSSLTSSAPAPSFSATPIFGFGSSVAPSTSVVAVSTSGVQSTNLKANTVDTASGNLSSSIFGVTSSAMTGTGSSIFGFSAPVTSSTAKDLPKGSPFGNVDGSLGGARASSTETVVATATQTMPVQFGSSASSPVFGSTGPTTFTSSTLFSSSSSAAKLFSSGTSFGLSSAASSSETSSSSGATSNLFGSNWQPTKSPIFGTSSSSSLFNSPLSTGFSFGASPASVAETDNAPSMVFGSSTGASSGSIFSFSTAASNTSSLTSFSQTQPVFGNNISVFTAVSGNSDQMNMEDSMSEDPVQASTPAVPVFGQPPVSPPSGPMFGSSTPPATLPFQFGGQQNQATPQSASPFQASGSLDFSAGGSFSLGTGDKSTRRMVRVKRGPKKK